MPTDPDMVYVPVALDRDRRLTLRDRDTLLHLLARADQDAHCDLGLVDLARVLGVTTRTARRRLARLQELGYLVAHDDGIELHRDLVMGDDAILMSDLPPLSDEQFARLQEADDPEAFDLVPPGRRLFVELPRALVEGRPYPGR